MVETTEILEAQEEHREHFYEEDDRGRVYVTTSTGWRVECMPVGDLLMRVGSKLKDPEEPEPPTYTMTDVTGDTREIPHDEVSIEDPKTTDAEREAWAEYLDLSEEYDRETLRITRIRNEQKARFIALRGIKVEGIPSDLDEWAREQEDLYGLEIPTPPRERLAAFLHHEVVRTESDGIKISAGIFRATGLDEEVMDQIEATFLGSMGRTGRANPETDQGTSEEEEPET
jgi:hypothetical protein